MRFDIVTIFPRMFGSYFNESILKRAQKKKLITVKIHDLRHFAEGKHRTVDDAPYGGGAGMVLKVEPIFRALGSILKNSKSARAKKTRVILFSTRGKKFDAKIAKRFAAYGQLILICGRYEGVDERVAKHVADEEISIGDFVLSGGELAAMMVVDAVSRFIPGVLGKRESLEEIKGSYPVYTRPELFKRKAKNVKLKTRWRVPKVLLSGNHKKIKEWRESVAARKAV